MDPIQAINVLSQVVKTARLPYNEHVVLERCVDILTQSIQSKSDSDANPSDGAPVTFEEPEQIAEVVSSSAPTSKGKTRARARKGGK
jgi:hypothetical protein